LKTLFLFLVLSIGSLPLMAQYTVERELFIPPEYYVGDTAQLDLLIFLDNEVLISVPENLPQQDWLEIQQVQVEQEDNVAHVIIRFRSFYPGNRALPPLDLGGIRLSGITLFTSSVSEQMGISTIRGLRDQVQLPGASLLLTLIILLLLIIPPGLFFLIRFLIRRLISFIERMKQNAPFRRFVRLLVQLRQDEVISDPQRFYTRLSGGIRDYLSDRSKMDFKSCTTTEMLRRKIPGVDKKEWTLIISILKKSDLVKYAGESSSIGEMESYIKQIDKFARAWEEEERHAYL